MVARHGHQHGFAQHRLEHQPFGPRHRHAQQAAVQPPRGQRVGELGRVVLAQLQLHQGVGAAECAQRLGHEAMRRRRAGEADRERVGLPLGHARHALLHRLHVLQHAQRLGLEQPARVGERHAARMAAEQRHAQLAFECLDLQAQRWLLDAELLGRACHVAGARDGDEVAQCPYVHIFLVLKVPCYFI